MTWTVVEPYIDYILDHFNHIVAFFFIASGLWKILRKNKILEKTEELLNKLPKEDEWTFNLIKFIDKGIIFFAIPSIIVGVCILLTMDEKTKFLHIYHLFIIYTFIGFVLNFFGILGYYKRIIKNWYSLQNFQPMEDWIDIHTGRSTISKDAFKDMKLVVIVGMIGKFTFYSGIIILCFL